MNRQELEVKLPWTEGNTYRRADIPDHWIELVSRLDDDLRAIDPNYRLTQVKEKFGSLRYYVGTFSPLDVRDQFNDRIRTAEHEVFEMVHS